MNRINKKVVYVFLLKFKGIPLFHPIYLFIHLFIYIGERETHTDRERGVREKYQSVASQALPETGGQTSNLSRCPDGNQTFHLSV